MIEPNTPTNTNKWFWPHVDRSGGDDACWTWNGAVHKRTGYGTVRFNLRNRGPHAVAWELENEREVPDGLFVCHSCDVRYPIGDNTYRRCCNPKHLWLGSPKENTQDAKSKGRLACGERAGVNVHPNSYPRGDAHPSRSRPETRPRGEEHGNAKLTAPEVLSIRERFDRGEHPGSIAQDFNISKDNVRLIGKRKAWSWL